LPGITGWAQVNGRNEVSWEDRLEMDVWYVDHRSPSLDARILGRTFGAVFGRRGISGRGHVTMEPFDPQRGADRTREGA
jgi:lipopolysaccharide/colanic/teichoic acid biosynthesis glycosyltransferase